MKSTRAFITVVLISLLVAAATAPAGAERPRKRTETADYLIPMTSATLPTGGGFGTGFCNLQLGCAEFMPERGERSVSVSIEDATGMAVYGYVYQDRNGDGWSDTGEAGPICGRTSRPVPISDAYPVLVFVHVGRSAALLCQAAATHGTFTAEFSTKGPRLPRAFDSTDH